jgi:hypothetical protein
MDDVLALQNPAGTAAPSEDGRAQGFHRDAAQLPLYHPEGHRSPPRIEFDGVGVAGRDNALRRVSRASRTLPSARPRNGRLRRCRWADRRHANDPCRRLSPVAERPGESPLTEPTTVAQPWPREPLKLPLKRLCCGLVSSGASGGATPLGATVRADRSCLGRGRWAPQLCLVDGRVSALGRPGHDDWSVPLLGHTRLESTVRYLGIEVDADYSGY